MDRDAMDQDSGCVRNVAYTRGYYRELSPTSIATALELRGLRAPDLGEALTYCELGMGFGLSLLANAACFPRMRFFGNDFNPQHVSHARGLADAAGLGNVELFDDRFERLRDRELPPMDLIVLHGVYSWVSPQERCDIVAFIARQLKPGGVVYVSHNALPGWSPLMPLRDMFRLHGQRLSPPGHSPVQRHRAALEFVSRLAVEGAAAFVGETVRKQIEQLADADEHYVAHEYFNPYWQPQYVHEVASEMAEAGLVHASWAQLGDHAEAALLTEAARRELAQVDDVLLRETLRDCWINRRFRRDLYVRAASLDSPEDAHERRLERRWVLSSVHERLNDVVVWGLDRAATSALLDALGRRPFSLRELVAQPVLAELGHERVLHALLQLSGMGHVQPALKQALIDDAQGSVRRFNDAVLGRLGEGGLQHLASPVTGQADGWTPLALLQIALAREGLADARSMARAMLGTHAAWGRPVRRSGRALGEEEAAAFLLDGCERFLMHEAPLLRALGVL